MGVKFCECGCGKPTPISKWTDKRRGHVKGEPQHFIHGHNNTGPVGGMVGFIKRFWVKVNKNGPMPSAVAVEIHPEIAGTQCWEWTGFIVERTNGSYGRVRLGDEQLAHRVAWFLETGEWPEPCGLHKCDNGICVRFSHLFEGTEADNGHDRKVKGRASRLKGSKNPFAKLNTKQVIEIRKRVAAGEPHKLLAEYFGVAVDHIAAVAHHRAWKHVTM